MTLKLSNFGRSTLAQPLPASGGGSDTVTVQASHGSRFPVVSAPDYSKLVLTDSAGTYEVVKVTAHVADATTLTITRAQEGTVARDWPATTTAVYNTATAAELDTMQSGVSNATFPAGTRLVFQQLNPPTGWTRETGAGYNDATMRVMTGTCANGGSTAWSSSPLWGALLSSSSVAITTAQMPYHSHGGATNYVSNDHTHSYSGNTGTESALHTHTEQGAGGLGAGFQLVASGGSVPQIFNTGTESAAHTHYFSGTTSGISANHTHAIAPEGGSQGHSHTWGAMQMKYVDFVIGIKN